MKVELINKTLTWTVDGETRATISHNLLGDKNRAFLPYVEMFSNGDIIELIDWSSNN